MLQRVPHTLSSLCLILGTVSCFAEVPKPMIPRDPNQPIVIDGRICRSATFTANNARRSSDGDNAERFSIRLFHAVRLPALNKEHSATVQIEELRLIPTEQAPHPRYFVGQAVRIAGRFVAAGSHSRIGLGWVWLSDLRPLPVKTDEVARVMGPIDALTRLARLPVSERIEPIESSAANAVINEADPAVLAKIAVIAEALSYPGNAGDESVDDYYEHLFWNCLYKLGNLHTEEAERQLEFVAGHILVDGRVAEWFHDHRINTTAYNHRYQ